MRRSTTIQMVIFDLGNVLAKVKRNELARELAKVSPLDPAAIEESVWGNSIELDSETGRIDSHEHFRRIKTAIQLRDDISYEMFQNIFLTGLEENAEGIEVLRNLHERGVRTSLLSNTSFLHARFVLNNEILVTIPEFFIFSFKLGCMKPDPRLWKKALEYSHLSAEECIYIDDIPEFCTAADQLGFNTINYRIGKTRLMEELQKYRF
ncbi:MAG TPA: HAD family phosphatase [Spirochaetia bacterium]|nr:HAD family phosphatase [Spirochaetia bacterium]